MDLQVFEVKEDRWSSCALRWTDGATKFISNTMRGAFSAPWVRLPVMPSSSIQDVGW